eukprot:2585429-Pyramimonas_sp.AAC.1
MSFQTCQYASVSINPRLDATAQQARTMLEGNFSAARVREFLEEIDEDAQAAAQAADKDSAQRWRDWCQQACSGGARGMHRIT